MKIFPSNHSITEVPEITNEDISLGYVGHKSSYSVSIIPNDDLMKSSKKKVMAYDEFDDPDTFFFNDEDIRLSVDLKRFGSKYIYEPSGSIEFTPTTFSYSVVVKKQQAYRNDTHYNFRVAVSGDDADLSLSRTLIPMFGDAYTRGICPQNIQINGGSIEPTSLINTDINSTDFIIVPDGHWDKNKIEEYLDEQKIVWIHTKQFEKMLINGDNKAVLHYADSKIYSIKDYPQTKATSVYTFQRDEECSSFPRNNYTYTFLCDSILLLERKTDGAYIIVSSENILKDAEDNIKLVYEIFMHCYLTCTFRSRSFQSWITDNPIDYLYYQSTKYNLRHKKINLDSILRYSGITDNYSLIKVSVDSGNVFFASIDGENNLLFYKTSSLSNRDPEQPDDSVSFYTTRGTVVYHSPKEIFLKEDPVTITSTITDNKIYITVSPLVSSAHRLYLTTAVSLEVPDSKIDYCLCTKPAGAKQENSLSLVPRKEFSELVHGIRLAYIEIIDTPQIQIYDTRVKGGGLRKDQPNDYDLIDIGNSNGRPYRIGSTIVFHLPSVLKKYKERIEPEVEKHIAAGDCPIFLYDREGELN